MRALVALSVGLVSIACGDSGESGPSVDGGASDAVGGGGGAGEVAGAGGEGYEEGHCAEYYCEPFAMSFPQAIDGTLLANPDVYPKIPLRVAFEDQCGGGWEYNVRIGLPDADSWPAVKHDDDGTAMAWLPIADLPEGPTTITATADFGCYTHVEISADLVVAREGVQLTSFGTSGVAATPQLHRADDALWLTWCDRYQGSARMWLRRLDGGGRSIGGRIELLGGAVDVESARAAFGTTALGVLYQTSGYPYVDHFAVVDTSGAPLHGPIDLDLPGWSGAFGGDIAFDGQGWVVAYRLHDGAGSGQILWARIEETTGNVTGPVVVAASGDGTAIGGFAPFTPVGIASLGATSMVSFVRESYSPLLDMLLPKSQLATVGLDGTLAGVEHAGPEDDLTFHREARISRIHDTLMPVWGYQDLASPDDEMRQLFAVKRSDGQGKLPAGAGVVVVDAVDDRDEPLLIEHPSKFAVLAFTDNRSYTLEGLEKGRIELRVITVEESLAGFSPHVFGHARFIEGTADLHAASAGSNIVLTWLDERHGGGVLDPQPEVWFDTVWF